MYKSRDPNGYIKKGYRVHREPRLPDFIRYGWPTLFASAFPPDFQEHALTLLAMGGGGAQEPR